MRRALLLGMVLAVAACRADTTDPTPPTRPSTISGSYQLATVDGRGLPFNVVDLGNYRADLVSGTLTLNEDGTYAEELDVALDDGVTIRATTDNDIGNWKVTGGAITLASTQQNFSQLGTVSENAVTLQSSEHLIAFRR